MTATTLRPEAEAQASSHVTCEPHPTAHHLFLQHLLRLAALRPPRLPLPRLRCRCPLTSLPSVWLSAGLRPRTALVVVYTGPLRDLIQTHDLNAVSMVTAPSLSLLSGLPLGLQACASGACLTSACPSFSRAPDLICQQSLLALPPKQMQNQLSRDVCCAQCWVPSA